MNRKIVAITGASKGIGKAIAQEFAKDHDVALIARHKKELEQVAQELHSFYKGIYVAFPCDVSKKTQVRETFKNIMRSFGSLDILINNAGTNSRKNLDAKAEPFDWFADFDSNVEGFMQEVNTNLLGTFLCSYVAAGYMLRSGGKIINISSIKGKEPTSSPGYGASKAGVIKLTRDFGKALAPKIRVNCIAPGFISTGMTTELSREKQEAYKKLIPQNRFGEIEEIAKVARFLASEDSSYITGAVIDVNGGYLMI